VNVAFTHTHAQTWIADLKVITCTL